MLHALEEVGRCSDAELVRRLEQLVKADRALSAKLLVHLGEVEARELHRERAFSSMFEYCRSGLGMSEGEAALRILAARVGRKFPLVVERLGAGAVNLSGIKLLAPLLTAENHVQLLDRVRGMSKRKIEVLVAELAPKPDVPARIRKLPEPREANPKAEPKVDATRAASCSAVIESVAPVCSLPSSSRGAEPGASHAELGAQPSAFVLQPPASQAAPLAPCSIALPPTAASSVPPDAPSAMLQLSAARVAPQSPLPPFARRPGRARASLTPLSPGRFKLQLTVGQETRDALKQLVALLRHQNPCGDMTYVVERALGELLEREMKRRFGLNNATDQQRTRKPAPAARPDTEVKAAATAQPDRNAIAAHAGKPDAHAIAARAGKPDAHAVAACAVMPDAHASSACAVIPEPHASSACAVMPDGEASSACAVMPDPHASSACAVMPDGEATAARAVMRDGEAAAESSVVARTERQVGSARSRYIPRRVLREVYARDHGQCAFVSEDGRRCSERGFLEVHHHHTAFARGGEATAENLRMMCRAHNLFLAQQDYGRGFMRKRLRAAGASKQLSLVPGSVGC